MVKFKPARQIEDPQSVLNFGAKHANHADDFIAAGIDLGIMGVQCLLQRFWEDSKKPFLNVYPTVLESLLNTSPEIDPALIPRSIIHELKAMEVRLPESSPLPSYFLGVLPGECFTNRKYSSWSLEISYVDMEACVVKHSALFGETPKFRYDTAIPLTHVDEHRIESLLRASLGIMLLACDSRYVEQVLLARDRDKVYDLTGRKKAEERAKNRGVFGFDLGKDIVMSPHSRRPHFAIRWTGPGRKIPKLVPVKGCFINKSLLGEIPTGYAEE